MENKEIILKSLKYIDENIEEQICLMDISSYIGYSEYHFSRLFKCHMGISVMEYVRKRKLIKASDEILKGEKIINVAFNSGYLSHSGFAKAFKQEFGFSPELLRAIIMQMDCLEGGNTMSHVFMKQTDIHATKEKLLVILQADIQKEGIEINEAKLMKVYNFACKAYEGVKRYSTDEYVTHPINVAIILAKMGASEKAVMAGMLCDVLSKTDTTQDMLRDNISEEVGDIVAKLRKFDVNRMELKDSEDVVMVKIAERLHNMRTVDFMDNKMKAIKSKETIELFMPIACKIGNEKLIAELNDLSLKYIM